MTQISSSLFLSLPTLYFSPFNHHCLSSTHFSLFFPLSLFLHSVLFIDFNLLPIYHVFSFGLSVFLTTLWSPCLFFHLSSSILPQFSSSSPSSSSSLLAILLRHRSIWPLAWEVLLRRKTRLIASLLIHVKRERANTQHRPVGRSVDPGLTRGRSSTIAGTLVWVPPILPPKTSPKAGKYAECSRAVSVSEKLSFFSEKV